MRKKILQKNFSSCLFSDFERELFQILAKLYPSGSSKMQCMPPVEPFEKKINFQNYCKSSFLRLSKSFWEFWHKLLAWLSNFLSTWTTSVIIIPPTFFQRTIFQIFSDFFSTGLTNMQTSFPESYLQKVYILRNRVVLFLFFWFLSLSGGRFLVFVEIFGRFFTIEFRVSSEIIPE